MCVGKEGMIQTKCSSLAVRHRLQDLGTSFLDISCDERLLAGGGCHGSLVVSPRRINSRSAEAKAFLRSSGLRQ
jgi:hypothetical protein